MGQRPALWEEQQVGWGCVLGGGGGGSGKLAVAASCPREAIVRSSKPNRVQVLITVLVIRSDCRCSTGESQSPLSGKEGRSAAAAPSPSAVAWYVSSTSKTGARTLSLAFRWAA